MFRIKHAKYEIHRLDKLTNAYTCIEVYDGYRAKSKARNALFLYRKAYPESTFRLVTKNGTRP